MGQLIRLFRCGHCGNLFRPVPGKMLAGVGPVGKKWGVFYFCSPECRCLWDARSQRPEPWEDG